MLGREMRRTLNAIQQRFRRVGYSDFAYTWVAENLAYENPHVHLTTNHRVQKSEFLEFAEWVESLWGHGFAHIEKIRHPESAGNYILKAVKYVAKGEDGEQGTVYGNRYGISRNIRVRESSTRIYEREAAADTLQALTSRVPECGVEQLGPYLLTRYGLVFPAHSTFEQLEGIIDDLEYGVIPG